MKHLPEQMRLARQAAAAWADDAQTFQAIGKDPLAACGPELAKSIRAAFRFYAESGAVAAVHALRLNNQLPD